MFTPGSKDSITDVAGVLVGHSDVGTTGCTVVRFPGGATASVAVRGGGPGTRETDLLDPVNTVQLAHAVLLTGGSAYGLAAADGVMRYLEVLGEGIPMNDAGLVVPIVPAAVIFDLLVGDSAVRPTKDHGYQAANHAAVEFERGSVGAGRGAVAGALKGGVGSASVVLDSGVTVGALVVANPVGSVFDATTGMPWGTASPRHKLRAPDAARIAALAALTPKTVPLNTTIGVIVTDASLSKAACQRVASAAHDGLARAVRPAHSPFDGDTLFALSTGSAAMERSGRVLAQPGSVMPPLPKAFPAEVGFTAAVSEAAAICVERAVVDAMLTASRIGGSEGAERSRISTFPGYTEVFQAE